MSVAHKPNMDKLAKVSRVGLVKTVEDNLKPGSDVANLSVLGYDPAIYYSGRSPLEAGSIGIDMKPTDVSFRTNLVTLSDEPVYEDKTILDYCADDISTEEAAELIKFIDEKLGTDEFRFLQRCKLPSLSDMGSRYDRYRHADSSPRYNRQADKDASWGERKRQGAY